VFARRTALFGALCAAVLAVASPAGAHALLERSVPPAGAVLQHGPAEVLLTFTEVPEPSLSSVHVLDSTGRQVDAHGSEPVPGEPLELRVPLGALPNGAYTVTWRTVSRVDGHVTGGAFAFGVGVTPSAAPAAPTNTWPSPGSVASRWALYTGLAGLLGLAWVWALAFSEPPLRTWYAGMLWATAAAGTIGLAVSQASDAGVGLGRLLATPLGTALWWRFVPILAAGAALLAAGRAGARGRRGALIAAGLFAAASMLADVLAGHAAATPGPLRWPNVADQWVHIVSIGTWLGGLAALLAALGPVAGNARAAAARRFSAVAGIALAATALTGVLRAVDEVGRWSALVTTDFGRLVAVKAALLLVLAVLGAVNRYRGVPAAAATVRTLRRIGGTELAVAVAVLGVTGVLTGLAPPSLLRQSGRTTAPIVVSGADFATSVRVRLEIAPGYPGTNRFTARIVDYDSRRPVTGARVTLRFTQPERPDVGASTLALVPGAPGTYAADGANMSLTGTWSIDVVIERGLQSTEVSLNAAARTRPQTVRAIRSPGQPTLYTIEIGGGIVLDTYLDPGRPGLNEVHATFLAANGQELPVPALITMTVAPGSGGPARRLPVRRFGPGHFIGDARLGAGAWHVEFAGAAKDGTVLTAHLDVTL
jgi:copper transport protein